MNSVSDTSAKKSQGAKFLHFLVTGASSGIGAATAKLALEKGHHVLMTGRRRERLEEVARHFPKDRVQIATFDIRKPSEVANFCELHAEDIKKLDVLVNNAGLARGTEKLQEGRLEDWQEMLDTNVLGLLQMTRGILPAMIQKKSGHIVNIGSVAGKWVYPGGGVYCASKYAVRALSEGLRMDLIGTNIRVTNIEPGMVETEFSEVRLRDKEKAKSVYSGLRPLTAEDIAESLLWCLERPAHVNIQELVIFPTDQAAVGQVYHSQREVSK